MKELEQYITEAGGLVEKWKDTLICEDAPAIRDTYRLTETAKMLEQQRLFNESYAESMGIRLANEDGSVTNSGSIATWDPVLVSMVRRAAPVLMAYDLANVQTMSMPTGLVFCLHSEYTTSGSPPTVSTEALFFEPDTTFSGVAPTPPQNAALQDPFNSLYDTGRGMATSAAEGDIGPEMSLVINKTQVTAKERQLKGSYSIEVQQDLRAVHNLDAEGEISNIMSTELLVEINREFVRTLYIVGNLGCAATASPGTYDLDVDADGRWAVEKFKGLVMQISLEGNQIYYNTRRGLGNKVVASPDVITALYMAGVLDTTGVNKLNAELGAMEPSVSTYVGKMLGRFDVYVDPYTFTVQSVIVGYRGAIPWDAGLYYCPYVPLQMFRATDPKSFMPRIAYKTRYGLVANPFVTTTDGGAIDGMNMTPLRNPYYRKFKVLGIA